MKNIPKTEVNWLQEGCEANNPRDSGMPSVDEHVSTVAYSR